MLKKLFKRTIKSTFIVLMLVLSTSSMFAVVDMTPYPTYRAPSTFWQGAQYELAPGKDFAERIAHDLPEMKNNYNINCLNLYALETLSTQQLDVLFNKLSDLQMQAVVRIEWYDPAWMNFEPADADMIINHYSSLIQYVSSSARRAQVAYFLLNVPVDDPAVTDQFKTDQYSNGRDNPAWASSQVTFVQSFVSKMRAKCNSYGFTTAKQYVSVFYGWDYAYPIPSYASSNADGYDLWNVTYPQDKTNPPDENQSDAVIINQSRLQIGMNKFMQQYPTQSKVVEYAFHTSEFNGGVNPNQDAGLVKTKAAKQKGLRATNAYYNSSSFTGMRGTQYFGWNLLKEEGTPLVLLDWCLDYPKKNTVEAENSSLYGSATSYSDAPASNGKGVSGIDGTGDAVAVFNVTKSNSFQIRYACSGNGQLSLYIDGQYKQKVSFSSTGAWTGAYSIVTVTVDVPWNATIRLQFDSGDHAANIDYFVLGDGSLKIGNDMTDNPEHNTSSNISIYPNPFETELKVVLSETSKFKTLHIMDEAGRLIEVKNIEGLRESTIGTSYKPGLYWLQFISPVEVKSKTVIKK